MRKGGWGGSSRGKIISESHCISKDILYLPSCHPCQISSSALAISVYKYLEDFDKLEKRLHEGHGAPASARSPLNMQDIRSKMDKFIKSLEPHDLQVDVTSFRSYHFIVQPSKL